MPVLLTPEIHGLGTPQAESMLSILHRTASIYNVSAWKTVQLVARVSEASPNVPDKYKSITNLLGYSSTNALFLHGLFLVTGRAELAFTTLSSLRYVLGPRNTSVISPHFRWCPDCLHPKNDIPYGLLAHQLQQIIRCPIHQVALNDRCLSCGHTFKILNFSPITRECSHCKSLLSDQHRTLPTQSPYAEWCAQQVLNLVAYVTNPELTAPKENWGETFRQAITGLFQTPRRQYTKSERDFISIQCEFSKSSVNQRPSLASLLRIASIQAVDIVNFIEAPIENCAPRLLDIGGAKDARSSRRNHPQAIWLRLEIILEDLLATDDTVMLPTKKSIVYKAGLTPTGLWQHFPSLCARYCRERDRRLKIHKEHQYDKALKAAEKTVALRLSMGKDIQIRDEGMLLMKEFNLSKATAERVIHAALDTYKKLIVV